MRHTDDHEMPVSISSLLKVIHSQKQSGFLDHPVETDIFEIVRSRQFNKF